MTRLPTSTKSNGRTDRHRAAANSAIFDGANITRACLLFKAEAVPPSTEDRFHEQDIARSA